MKSKTNDDELMILDEARFKKYYKLNDHYYRHVLKWGEGFDYKDPKFPRMPKSEYARRAEDLSNADASVIKDINELMNARGVIGWEEYRKEDGFKKLMKINTDSPLHPGYMEIVAYGKDGNIYTYMLARRKRKYREFKHKIGELPENVEEQEQDISELELEED